MEATLLCCSVWVLSVSLLDCICTLLLTFPACLQSVSSCREEQESNLFAICPTIPVLALEAFWLGNTVLALLEYLKLSIKGWLTKSQASTTMQMLQRLLLLLQLCEVKLTAHLQQRHKPGATDRLKAHSHSWKLNATAG